MMKLAERVMRRSGAGRRSRRVAYALVLPVLALSMPGWIDAPLRLVYILLGFSLIIFLHEFGHFIVARMCSVKCLAFSIGIGPRLCGWRQGAGLTWGNDPYDPDSKKDKESGGGLATSSDVALAADEPPHGQTIGDTDYRVSWLPLGGYVRMLGQDDMDPTKVSDDPHAFNRRPIWQRMCIVSAGVVMNVIFAAVTFFIIFYPSVGVDFPPAVLGPVYYDSPAYKAGLRMGDKILAIDGQAPRGFLEFTDIQMACALSTGKDPITFLVQPADGGKSRPVPILPVRSAATGFLAIGVEPMPGVKVGGKGSDYVNDEMDKSAQKDPIYQKNREELKKIEDGDKIISINDVPVNDSYPVLYDNVQKANGQPIKLGLQNLKGQAAHTITLYPRLEQRPGVAQFPPVLGLQPRTMLGEPKAGYPAAKAGLKEGDQVQRVGDRTYPTTEQMIEIISSHPGDTMEIGVIRAGATILIKATPANQNGKGFLNVPVGQDLESLTFIPAAAQTPVGLLDLPADATIAALNGQPVADWGDVYGLTRTLPEGSEVKVTFKTGTTEVTHTLPLTAADHTAVTTLLNYQLGVRLENLTQTQVAKTPGGAVMMGLEHTQKFIVQVYMTLAGLFRQTVSPDNLHGIVGITKVGYDIQQRGPVWLWYILAMVSVNLAVANFLPLPIVDGGLFLLLIVEKIRGRPLSLKVQSAIQMVGIVLLVGLFLFVTWNDIGLFTK